jgi:hypothetical protein
VRRGFLPQWSRATGSIGTRRTAVSSLSRPLATVSALCSGPPALRSGWGSSLGASHPRLWSLVARTVVQRCIDDEGAELGLRRGEN